MDGQGSPLFFIFDGGICIGRGEAEERPSEPGSTGVAVPG